MKIAIFVSFLPPHVGGIEVVAESQIQALVASGQEVSVVTSACGAKQGTKNIGGYEIHRVAAWNYFEEKMNAVFPIYSPSLFWHAYKTVKNSDVVHAHDSFYLTSLAAAFWARVLRKPLVVTQHVDMVPHPKRTVNFVQKVIYGTTGRYILRSSSKIIVLNERVKSFLISMNIDEAKIIFLPNGVNMEVFSPATKRQISELRKNYKLPEDKTLVLFVGRFAPKKGINKILSLPPIENMHFVLAGGNAPDGVKRNDQHFLGPVSRTDMPGVYKMSDIFLLPSEGEGFPVTVQEAMASRLPVITSDDPAYRLYRLSHEHVMFIGPTATNIAEALITLGPDPTRRQEMGEYARDYVLKNFSWSKNIQKLVSIYRESLS